jgi:hypothetical protein
VLLLPGLSLLHRCRLLLLLLLLLLLRLLVLLWLVLPVVLWRLVASRRLVLLL